MNAHRWPRIFALAAFCLLSGAAFSQSPESPDGLVRVKSPRMEMAWLLPGADFRPYTKVIIGRTQVAFRQNWLKNYNSKARLGAKVTQEQANEIMKAAQTNLDDIFVDAFRKAGYEIVDTPGPDVLRVNSSILDLNVNAPQGQGSGQTVWIITAGNATLIVEARDTVTNALLGRVADRRSTQDLGRKIANTTTNLYDFRLLFTHWAGICVKGLGELKRVSPVPADLKPNQRL